ncbi:MAG TPA: insulinase family protein [Vicinamibacterales bacterium]|jgi:zinc protease|nr:insulinase family protein [Vicinamibacterales bacterium]
MIKTKRLSRTFGVLLLLVAAAAAAQTFNPQDVIPLDKAIHTATLPNGLKYFVRQNSRPAKRVSLRLAVKAGSVNEADDQQGLAHLIEHMAFNGSDHFKPGELVSYFESTGSRLGPHVNAYTSFDETVYMLELPTDKPDIVAKGLTALADFAGGLTLSPEEINKERGVVVEEWRGGLGAGSRIRDKQFPILFYKSRYAERLPIGKPEILRNAPPERLRSFYDTWYRPDRMAVIAVGDLDASALEKNISTTFGGLKSRAPAAPQPDGTVPIHTEMLTSVVTDSEVTSSSVQIVRKRPRESEARVGDYRRQLLERFVDQMFDERFSDIARKADAKILGAGVSNSSLSRGVSTFSMGAGVQDGKLEEGVATLATEAKRVKEFGFSASEMDRAKKWMAAFYERAYAERDKTESGQLAAEYVRVFLDDEPSPGIEYEYKLVQQLLPGITVNEASAMAKTLLADNSRVILAISPQKPNIRIPSDSELQAAITAGNAAPVTEWVDSTSTRAIMERMPATGAVASRRTLDNLGVTIVRFANGVEAWLKPTDFKNDQVIFSLNASGGSSLAPPAEFPEATMSAGYVGIAGVGGMKALDLQKMLAGKLASARPFVSLSTHGISGSAAPAQLETALQLLYQTFTAPGDDPEAFALLKRQLDSMLANRGRSPQQVFSEKLAEVNSSNHYTSQPLTTERLATLDRGKMMTFYRQRFSNAADFTFFMVGAFKVDEAVPLLAPYVGSLPSTGSKSSTFRDVGVKFPQATERAKVEAGREPRGQTVMSFFADPAADPMEQEKLIAATTVLQTTLRDVLREELGQTYTVSVNLAQALPQRGGGHIDVRFGAAPENLESMTARVLKEIKRLQDEGPSADLTDKAKETARRGYETALKQNDYWLGRLQSVNMLGRDPGEILTRNERIDAVTPQVLQDVFKLYFPSDRTTVVTLVPAPTAP